MYSGNFVSDYDIYDMKMSRIFFLLNYLTKNIVKGNTNKALSLLYSSKTFEYLQKTETNFWWKSEEELKYLLTQELNGNMSAWMKQAF